MTEILNRIDDVLADSRIQELDLIIETLFGDPIPFLEDVSMHAPQVLRRAHEECHLIGDDGSDSDESEARYRAEIDAAYAIHTKISCGFRTWHQNPIYTIVRICNDEDKSVEDKIDLLTLIYSENCVTFNHEIKDYANHCISLLSLGKDPLRWDAWLYLNMHGEDGLQP